MRRQMVPQAFEHRRFARSDLARQHNKALPALHTVDQAGQRLFMLLAPIKVRRVGT